jgi:hypothetical protein
MFSSKPVGDAHRSAHSHPRLLVECCRVRNIRQICAPAIHGWRLTEINSARGETQNL